MTNPWILLPKNAPFILEEDRSKIDAFNRTAAVEHQFHTEVLPEPFLGNPDAPIVLLGLNPGFSTRDRITHADPSFAADSLRNLTHGPSSEYPFHLLNPQYRDISEGYLWWSTRLKAPIGKWGALAVSRRFLCVEFFPYHSENWSNRTPLVNSQEYSFHLVREALRRDALIIIMRSRSQWLEKIPELAGRHVVLYNNQRVTISPGNMSADAWSKLERAMTARA